MMSNRNVRRDILVTGILSLAWCLSGCDTDMSHQPKLKPLQESDFFQDGRASRPRVPGTVARGHLNDDELLMTGQLKGQDADLFPFPVTRELLNRGQERYDIYCAVCHDRIGTGNGMVVRRGFPKPPSFHTDMLRKAPAGHFVYVITHGFGRMSPYADRISPPDRWAIAAYVRALQLSQSTKISDLPEFERARLKNEPVRASSTTALGALSAW